MTANALPIPRATLDALESARNRALGALGEGFAAMAAGMDAARAAAVSFANDVGLSDDAKRALHSGNLPRERYAVERDGCATWRDVFDRETRLSVDRAAWSHVVEATDLERMMDRQARDEFRAGLMESPPEFNAANVQATLSRFAGDAPMIFQRGIANAFAKLDRRFRSHDGFKIGGRVILDRYFGSFGVESRGRETLRDIERVFEVLDGNRHPDSYAGIVGQLEHATRYGQPRPVVVECEWVRVRVFGNGNAHLWFTRPDLVRKVNRLLADYYGEVIGEGSDVADVSDMGPSYHLTPARDFGFFPTSEETGRALFERAGYRMEWNGARVLEPSAGKGALASIAKAKGAQVTCVEVQHGLAAELRRDGFNTVEGDFLAMDPARLGLFDCVVMNPPFDRGRDCDHVRHALQFLKPGGTLLAIMSAGTEFREDKRTASLRALIEKQKPTGTGWRGALYFQDLPENSFAHAGTNVNTVTLALVKA